MQNVVNTFETPGPTAILTLVWLFKGIRILKDIKVFTSKFIYGKSWMYEM